MKNLKLYLESLFDDEDELAQSADEFLVKEDILKKYKTWGTLKFRKEGDKYIVDVNGNIFLRANSTRTITRLTNDLYVFGVVKGDFDCRGCDNLESLEGAPQKCKIFDCSGCESLKTLKGAPQECKKLYCDNCRSLKSLKGCPKNIGELTCWDCPNLTDLDGLDGIAKVGTSPRYLDDQEDYNI